MYAVPAPAKVTIDGNLNDWDLSGQILTFVQSETADMQSARFAVMFDSKNLYLSAVVRDTTPMMNRHDPAAEGDKGWNGDACQFRISVNPTLPYPLPFSTYAQTGKDNPAPTHLTLWYYTDKHEPVLQIAHSMMYKPVRQQWNPFGVVPADFFTAKYAKAADGRGYTFEYAIPWSTLGAPAPLSGGQIVAGTVQFNYSDPTGLKTAGYSAWCYDLMNGPGVPYQDTSCWGKILFSKKGKLPREMTEEGLPPARVLPLKFRYDLPEDSQITIQLMDKDNVVHRILVPQGNRSAGSNVELWDGLDGQGQLLPAGTYFWKGIYHQPLSQKVLFSPHNSGQPPYQTDDGSGSWGGDHGTPQAVIAFDDGLMMSWDVAEVGSGIIRTDLAGRKKWGNLRCATAMATDGKRVFTVYGEVTALDLTDGKPLVFANGKSSLAPPPGGTATTNDATGVAYYANTIYVSFHDRDLVASYDAVSGNLKGTRPLEKPRHLAVTNEGVLLAVSGDTMFALGGDEAKPLAASHLDDPRGIAIGPDGAVYVANGGRLQNISVFDKSGKYLRSIGREGGRPRIGAYDPAGMLEPGGIACDRNNHMWVAERLDSPKRISEWNTVTGQLVKEFFGACAYFGYAYIDPRKPDEIYCHNVLWKINWKENSCVPISTIWRSTAPNMMWPQGPGGIDHPIFITGRNAHQYVSGGERFMSILSYREGNIYKPCAAAIQILRGNVFYGDHERFPVMSDAKKYPNGNYFWQDLNDDQTVQENELVPLAAEMPPTLELDADLNLYFGLYKVPPVRVETDGRPVYDLARRVKTPAGYGADSDGSVYSYRLIDAVAKFSPDGKVQWAFPGVIDWRRSLSMPLQAPGTLWGLTNYLGVAGEFTGWSDYFGTYHIFSRDGIYVGMLMRDVRRGGGLGPDVTATEVLSGQLVKPDGMDGRYFLIAGASDARVTEIFGLDTIKPLAGGTLTLTDSDVKLAAKALADYNARLTRGKRLNIVRGATALAGAETISRSVDAGRSFKVRAAYDAANLYLAFDVVSPTELVNSQPDPHLLFKGGNCLDIQLATDPKANPQRKTPALGDMRILVTQKDGKPFSVIYRPKAKGFVGLPIVLSSPTGKESFDVIEIANRVGLKYTKNPDGYSALVTIPQDFAGLALAPGQQLKMDIGVIYGNATGNKASARSYWTNNGFDANITNDVPSESRLSPAEWGIASVE